MSRALRVCSVGGCPELTTQGRCVAHRGEAERQRGTARQRGYGRLHETWFRPEVLHKNPVCVCTDETHGHGPECLTRSTVADHHPLTRPELVAAGMNPNDPRHGRGLCKGCHDKHTSTSSPGGWNAG